MSAVAEDMLKDLSARGVRLSRNGDKLRVVAPHGFVDEALRQRLAANKAALLSLLRKELDSRVIVNFRIAGDQANAWARRWEVRAIPSIRSSVIFRNASADAWPNGVHVA
jgi:predicted metal-dependent hydrolase